MLNHSGHLQGRPAPNSSEGAGVPLPEAWLPPGMIADGFALREPGPEENPAPERQHVAAAAPKRQREFLCGRIAARRALQRLGVPVDALPVGEARLPLWPPAVVGSITHDDRRCLAIVARSTDWGGIGVDLEPDAPLEAELLERIATPVERAFIAAQPPATRGDWLRRHFSAKEASYKAVYPRHRRFLGFHAIELSFEAESGGFRARCAAGAGAAADADPEVLRRLGRDLADGAGRWHAAGGSLISIFHYPPRR